MKWALVQEHWEGIGPVARRWRQWVFRSRCTNRREVTVQGIRNLGLLHAPKGGGGVSRMNTVAQQGLPHEARLGMQHAPHEEVPVVAKPVSAESSQSLPQLATEQEVAAADRDVARQQGESQRGAILDVYKPPEVPLPPRAVLGLSLIHI